MWQNSSVYNGSTAKYAWRLPEIKVVSLSVISPSWLVNLSALFPYYSQLFSGIILEYQLWSKSPKLFPNNSYRSTLGGVFLVSWQVEQQFALFD